MRIHLGDFPVVENKLGAVTIDLGHNVTITVHMTGVPTTLKPGDKLPLYTEVPDAFLRHPN